MKATEPAKKRIEDHSKQAFTLHELLVVMFTVAILALLAVRGMAQAAKQAPRIQCADNLKQVSAAFRIWAGSHSDRYPQQVSTTQGGAMINGLPVIPSNTYTVFGAMSNELVTPNVVFCPTDTWRRAATNFISRGRTNGDFYSLNVSYCVGRDAYQTVPQMFLSGDRNIYGNANSTNPPTESVLGSYGNSPSSPSSAGNLVALGTNVNSTLSPPPVGFTDKMHRQAGNMALTDGSVQRFSSANFYAARAQTGDLTVAAPGQNSLLFP